MSDWFWKIAASLAVSAILAICGWMAKQVKKGQALQNAAEKTQLVALIDECVDKKLEPINTQIKALQNVDSRIDSKLKPIHEEIQELSEEIKVLMLDEEQLKVQLTGSYRFRLIQLCKHHLAQGFMTEDQMDQLSEFFKIYEALGGNGQAKEYYDRTKKLPIICNSENQIDE